MSLQHEPAADELYATVFGMKVYKVGFVINPSAYFLGCSPDRRVYDSSVDEYEFLEMKCPSIEKVSDCKCLKVLNNQLSSKRNHDYFYQIMGQLGITGFAWFDFFIMTRVTITRREFLLILKSDSP